jgi:uncharacterized protein YdaU (DUF1376 family)
MNYYKRYMGDYGRDTGTLALADHGAYALLMDHYYSTEEPLPADYETLYRICRAMKKEEQAAVRKVADKFFPVFKDGLRHNDRVDIELTKYHAKAEANRENGKGGGRPRKKPDETQEETQMVSCSVPQTGTEQQSEVDPMNNLIPEARSQKLLRGLPGGKAV